MSLRPRKKLPKPKWCPWEPAAWASDPRVSMLSFHWRGAYFDLLNALMLDGELEWRQASFALHYRNHASPEETEPMLAELREFFEFRKEGEREFFSHSKVSEGRDRYFRAIEQRSKAGKANKGKRKASGTAVNRPSVGSLTESERRTSTSTSTSPSLSTSPPTETVELHPGDKDLQGSELEPKKQKPEWAAGLTWVNSLQEREQHVVGFAIEAVKKTRRGGKLADSVIQEILFQLSRFPEHAVEACQIYQQDHSEKSEKYLIGIARRMAAEADVVSRARS